MGALPPVPQPLAAGSFAPRHPLAFGGWGIRSQTPKVAPPPIADFWLCACVRRARIAVSNLTDNGQAEITYVERDLSKLAPLEMGY